MLEKKSWKKPYSGIALHTKIASFRRFTISHFWALALDLTPANKRTLLSEGGPSID